MSRILSHVARWTLASLTFAFAFVINPAFVAGCISNEDDEERAQAERVKTAMLAKLDAFNGTGAWEVQQDGETYELLVELTQSSKASTEQSASGNARFMSVAHACGSTTFYKSASACKTVYLMPVEGTLMVRRLGAEAETIVEDVPVRGRLMEGSFSLSFGENALSFEDNGGAGGALLIQFEAEDLGDEKVDFSVSRY